MILLVKCFATGLKAFHSNFEVPIQGAIGNKISRSTVRARRERACWPSATSGDISSANCSRSKKGKKRMKPDWLSQGAPRAFLAVLKVDDESRRYLWNRFKQSFQPASSGSFFTSWSRQELPPRGACLQIRNMASAGVSDGVYRTMARLASRSAYSEMVLLQEFIMVAIKPGAYSQSLLRRKPDIAVQLFGSKPDQFKRGSLAQVK